MSVQPEGDGWSDPIQPADQEPRVGGRPGPRPGRYSLVLIDNETGQSAPVDIYPLRLDSILRSTINRQLSIGWLVMQIIEAAKTLGASEIPPERNRLTAYPIVALSPIPRPQQKPFLPVWRRRREDLSIEDDDGGI